jgi:hypothetical protein
MQSRADASFGGCAQTAEYGTKRPGTAVPAAKKAVIPSLHHANFARKALRPIALPLRAAVS